jgi:hypothetical protein
VIRTTDAEKPHGEWNVIEVVCDGDVIAAARRLCEELRTVWGRSCRLFGARSRRSFAAAALSWPEIISAAARYHPFRAGYVTLSCQTLRFRLL